MLLLKAMLKIGNGSKLDSHSIVKNGSRIGKDVSVGNYVVIGGLPQDLGFDPLRERMRLLATEQSLGKERL